ncbi:C40 family peptidase [Oceaniglobus indicus]|uniref:C40 family peptidase n=1 Tax=Oceaniglobus indicus TaxID=2047749 RepID=UPI000C1A49A8|nr:NlpC/P60 family protein [Oceaniglobus indicus]
MSDRRETPANGRVAAAELVGLVEADQFVVPTPAQVQDFAAGIHAAPNGPLDRHALFGDLLDVFERRDGWAFVRAQKDGYCGYARESALGDPMAPTHAVRHRVSHIYPDAGFKAPPLVRLPFGARLTVTGGDDKWAGVEWSGGGGIVPRDHLRALDDPMPDPAATALLFLGTPYLWAGNTADGIDCSGLVQACCLAADISCRGDSDQQSRTLGTVLPAGADLRRNDVLFWKGHVALVEDPETMIHATANGMTTLREDIAKAVRRIEAGGDGPVTMHRRLVV